MSSASSFSQRSHSTQPFLASTAYTANPAFSTSSTAAYGIIVVIAIYYFLQYLEARHLPLSELLWNILVYITPSKLLGVLDSQFAPASPRDPEDEEIENTQRFDSRHHASKSNSLRRLMGLDSSTSLIMAVQRTRALSDLGSVFKSKPASSLPGLGNWDHSCYQNSVIQGLASLKSLPDFLGYSETIGEQADRQEGSTRRALRELTRTLNDEKNVGKTFWTPSELKSMSSWQQQDAQEYFSKVMDGLEKDIAKALATRHRRTGLERIPTSDEEGKKSVDLAVAETAQAVSRMNQLPAELQALVLRNPLEGLLAQRVGCQRCGYVEGLSLVPFNCLTVPLGRQWIYDIRECLDEYTALEPINGVECAKCTLNQSEMHIRQLLGQLSDRSPPDDENASSNQLQNLREDAQKRLELVERALEDEDFSDSALKKCQIPTRNYVSTTKSRQAVVARAPKALVIHVNRSIFDELTGEQSKNQAGVRFPSRFSLGSWCLGTQKEHSEASIENWNTDPTQSMLEDVTVEQSLESEPFYELRAVITHYGRHENGHYICYRRSPDVIEMDNDVDAKSHERRGPWWRLSDEEVTEVSEENVLAQGGVFMLFYEQVPSSGPNPVPKLEEGFIEATQTTSDQIEIIKHQDTSDIRPASIELEATNQSASEPHISSLYPTPPPEDLKESTINQRHDIHHQTHPRSPKVTSVQPPPAPTPSASSTITTTTPPPPSPRISKPASPPSPTPTDTIPLNHGTDMNDSSLSTNDPLLEDPPPPHTIIPTQPTSTLTAHPHPPPQPLSPRTGRGSISDNGTTTRSNKAMMESMAGFVQAN